MGETRYIYEGGPFENIGISPVTYRPEFFDLQIALKSEVLCKIRKRNNILPHRLRDIPARELKRIREFFYRQR